MNCLEVESADKTQATSDWMFEDLLLKKGKMKSILILVDNCKEFSRERKLNPSLKAERVEEKGVRLYLLRTMRLKVCPAC